MIDALCIAVAHLVAAFWSGLLWPMEARGNLIVCASGMAMITPGCLALHAVSLACWFGCFFSIALRMPILFPVSICVAMIMSFVRCFILIGLLFVDPTLFNAIHGQCGYAVLMASLSVIMVLAFRLQKYRLPF